ncbi:MAG: DNA mismatch repair protein MutS [Paenibacillaceae bacterium]|nr:DNA mismatch repair protein MutS [Paenibacillaceae bacterium]
MTKRTPMMEQYVEQKSLVPDALLFFRLGDFYELFMDDAIAAARALDITLTGREAGDMGRVPMCGVPVHAAQSYIAKLVAQQYKVAICEQDASFAGKGLVPRRIVRIVTPGTIDDGDDSALGALATIVREDGMHALVVLDCRIGHMRYAQFSSRALLVDALHVLSIAEWVLEEEERAWLVAQPWWRNSCAVTVRARAPSDAVISQFAQLSSEVVDALPRACRIAVGQLCRYVIETHQRGLAHIQLLSMQSHPVRAPLGIDASTQRHLELLRGGHDRNKHASLFGVLDKTRTALGSRLLRLWMMQPLTDIAALAHRHDAVDVLHMQTLVRGALSELLGRVYDMERLIGRTARGQASPRDMIALAQSLRVVPLLQEQLAGDDVCLGAHHMHEFVHRLDACTDVCAMIDDAVEPDVAMAHRTSTDTVRSGYDARLDALRTTAREGKQWIAALEAAERTRTGIRSLKVGYTKVFGYYIEVSRANVHAVPTDRYERKQTLANAERYVTAELVEHEVRLLEAQAELETYEQSVFDALVHAVAMHIPRMQCVAHALAQLDVFVALANVARTRRYVRPHMHEGDALMIYEGRHPVVETLSEEFMPNDTCLGGTDARMTMITGPNMAGKSTYMRQVALMVIMAHIGSFVPAARAHIPIVDHVFTRIGASDDLFGGQSTFMVEMRDIQHMLSCATSRSLLIIDELGRGTASDEGMAIAQAVIEHIHDVVQCKALVSTHYHALAHRCEALPGVAAARMAVEERGDRVLFLKKLLPGVASSSYGIYCAHIAGIPRTVVDRAYALLHVRDDDVPDRAPAIVRMEHPCVAQLRTLDVLHMTPMDALRWLLDAQQAVRDPDSLLG